MSPQFTQNESKGQKVSSQAGKRLCNLREWRPCVYRLLCTRSMLCFPPRGARAPQGSSEKVQVLVAQLYPTLWDPMDCSLQGSSVHEILQARILEWQPFPSPGNLPDPGIKPGSPALQILDHLTHRGSHYSCLCILL